MRALPLLITAAFLAAPALASHTPQGRCYGNTAHFGTLELGDGTAERTFYLDDRNHLSGNGLWIYKESNGIYTPRDLPRVQYWWAWLYAGDHNLQRGGAAFWSSDTLPDRDSCVDDPNVVPDTLLF